MPIAVDRNTSIWKLRTKGREYETFVKNTHNNWNQVIFESLCMLCANVSSFRPYEGEPRKTQQAEIPQLFSPAGSLLPVFFAGHMGINHGCLNVDVAEKFLYRPDVLPFFQHVSCEAVP